MRIGLVDVDGTKFPNLVLMKLSAWHKVKDAEKTGIRGQRDEYALSVPPIHGGRGEEPNGGRGNPERELQEKHPRAIYVNPLANFKALAGMEYDQIMGYCLELLMRCDGVTMAGDYRASKGCMIELAYAREYGIPVFFYDAEKHVYIEEET